MRGPRGCGSLRASKVRARLAPAVLLVLLGAASSSARPLRVLVPTTIRVQPRWVADAAALEFTANLSDDREAPVRGTVLLELTRGDGALERSEVPSGSSARVRLGPSRGALRVRASFPGDSAHAPAEQVVELDPTQPYVSLSLQGPSLQEFESAGMHLVGNFQVGELAPLGLRGLELALQVDGQARRVRAIDGGGRAEFDLLTSELGAPGVHSLQLLWTHGEQTVLSPPRRVVLRANTALTLHVDAERSGPLIATGALATRAGAIPNAPVQLLQGTTVLGAALTRSDGTYELSLAADTELEDQRPLFARFTPNEPWLRGSESTPVVLPATSAARLPAWAALGPLAFVLGALVWVTRRRGPRERPEEEQESDAEVSVDSQPLAAATESVLEVLLLDASTGRPLMGALLAAGTASGPSASLHRLTLRKGERWEGSAQAPGYAPLSVQLGPLAPGAHRVRVRLRSWREEVVQRLRSWWRQRGLRGPMPTPGELLANAGKSKAWIEAITAGAYAPAAPDGATVEGVDTLAESSGTRDVER